MMFCFLFLCYQFTMAYRKHRCVTSYSGFVVKVKVYEKSFEQGIECHISRLNQNVKPHSSKTESEIIDNARGDTGSFASCLFVNTFSLNLPIKGCLSAAIVDLKSVLDADWGIVRPYVLVKCQITPGKYTYRLYGLFDNSKIQAKNFMLKFVGEFFSDAITGLSKFDNFIELSDGPCIVYQDELEQQLFATVVNRKSLQFDILRLCGKSERNQAISVRKTILGWTYSFENDCVIFIWKEAIDNAGLSHLCSVIVRPSNEHTRDKTLIYLSKKDISNFVSHEYSAILNVIIWYELKIDINFQSDDDKVRSCKSHVFATTSRGHLLEFVCGKPKRCVDIPSIFVHEIVILRGFTPYICLHSSKEETFIGVSCCDMKVKTIEKNVMKIAVDDFIGSGTEQVLLMSSCTTNWYLTDFGPTLIRHPLEKSQETHMGEDSSISTAVEALHSRLRIGMCKLLDGRLGHSEREQFIEDCCYSIQSMTLRTTSPPYKQPELVHLCGNGAESKSNDGPATSLNLLTVKDVWQRLFDGRWVVGVDLMNMSDRDISDICLWACLPSVGSFEEGNEESVWQSITTSVQAESDYKEVNILDPTCAKRRRIEHKTSLGHLQQLGAGQSASVTFVSAQPIFGFNGQKMLLLFLTFMGDKSGSCETSDNLLSEKRTMFCRRIPMSMAEMTNHSLNLRSKIFNKRIDIERRRDVDCMEASQPVISLSLYSVQTTADSLIKILLQNGCEHHPCYDCFLLPERLENLRCVRLMIIRHASRQMLSIYTRNKAQLWCVLHFLYSILPDDVVFIPNHLDRTEKYSHSLHLLQSSLRKELNFTMVSLNRLLKNPVESDDLKFVNDSTNVIDHGENSAGSSRVEEDFSHLQCLMSERRKPFNISNNTYKTVIHTLSKISQLTDDIFLCLKHKL